MPGQPLLLLLLLLLLQQLHAPSAWGPASTYPAGAVARVQGQGPGWGTATSVGSQGQAKEHQLRIQAAWHGMVA
jgi:hypothetical protein